MHPRGTAIAVPSPTEALLEKISSGNNKAKVISKATTTEMPVVTPLTIKPILQEKVAVEDADSMNIKASKVATKEEDLNVENKSEETSTKAVTTDSGSS